MTKCGLLQFLFLLLVTATYGQKVKYKDIYGLLSTKQFVQAEPFLKNYLRENPDNPNAQLFMGSILQDKASASDILRETDLSIARMDSAILYYEKARATVDDRELKRNKEYYEGYNRRDLRTGEFGVKLSDIQFDLDKRVEALRERIQRVRMVRHHFTKADSLYRKSNVLFLSLQQSYPSQEKLYLRADERTLQDLRTLSLRFDSATTAFAQYLEARRSLEKSTSHRLTTMEVADFARDGRDVVSPYEADVQWWDYRKFADNAREVITKFVLPVRELLVARDVELNRLRKKLTADSVSVRSELAGLMQEMPDDEWRKYDPEPLPSLVLGLKATDLEYQSLALEHRPLRDSADIHLQIGMLRDELKVLSALDSLAARISDEPEVRVVDYNHFVSKTFGTAGKLREYVRGIQAFTLRERSAKEPQLATCMKALNYIIDDADSIPLFGTQIPFVPLLVAVEEYTIGLSFADSTQAQGYFYTISPSRMADLKAYFPVAPDVVIAGDTTATKALGCADPDGGIYYALLFSETDGNKFPSTVAKISRSGGLAWRKDIVLAFEADELLVHPESGDLIIRNGTREIVVSNQ